MSYSLLSGIALADTIADPASPKPFRLLKTGVNDLTRNGFSYQLVLSDKHISDIANHQKMKGEKIPIDSRHALLVAATAAGVSEAEAVKAVPHKCAAFGFADLEARDDGLYAVNVEFLPLAAEQRKLVDTGLEALSPELKNDKIVLKIAEKTRPEADKFDLGLLDENILYSGTDTGLNELIGIDNDLKNMTIA